MNDHDQPTRQGAEQVTAESSCILIVDDNQANLQILRAIVEKEGYRVLLASDGQHALNATRSAQPDLILMDVRMKGMDGYEVCERLKQDEACAHIPVIFLSAASAASERARGFEVGAVDYIPKPIQAVEVLARVGQQLRLAGLQRDLRKSNAQLEERIEERTASLRISEARYRSVMTASVDPLVCCDGGGKIQFASDSVRETFGWEPEELHGRNVRELIAKDSVTEQGSTLISSEHTSGEQQHEQILQLRGRRRDGASFPCDVRISRATEPCKGERLRSWVFRDLSERNKLQSSLRQFQKLDGLGQLSSGIAHDFNNLLTAILGHAEIAEMQLARLPEVSKDLCINITQIQTASQRAAMLTRQLLTFSRKANVSPELIDTKQVLQELELLLERLMPEDVRLQFSFADERLLIFLDRSQLEQVVINLAVNACDAMPKGGLLSIELSEVIEADLADSDSKSNAFVCLCVRDTGCGMDAETIKNALEPFFTTKPVGKGTGLGLATVRDILHEAGGEVRLHSELGEGTQVRCYFPAKDGAPSIKPVRSPMVEAQRGQETILVCEDDHAVRLLTCKLLTKHGYRALSASHPEEAIALAAIEAENIRLLITDVIMPGLRGPDLVDTIRKHGRVCPVLFVSGYSDEILNGRGGLPGDTAFLPKPFSASQLLSRVRELLDAGVDPEVRSSGQRVPLQSD